MSFTLFLSNFIVAVIILGIILWCTGYGMDKVEESTEECGEDE